MSDQLPPHSELSEVTVIGALLSVGNDMPAHQIDAMLERVHPGLFYLSRCRDMLAAILRVRKTGHAVTTAALLVYGNLNKETAIGEISELMGSAISPLIQFDSELPVLQEFAHRRWLMRKAAELRDLASSPSVSIEDTRGRLSELLEATEKKTGHSRPIELVSMSDLVAYEPDPRTYLVGENVISRQSMTVICGWPGLGKSRLTTTLGIAGARGTGHWMGYTVRRQWRTLFLQSENSLDRLKQETADVSISKVGDWIRWSKPCALSFHRAEFRRALAQIWAEWPFDMLVIDPWTDVVRDAEAGDVAEAFDNIRSCLPQGEQAPAVVVVAHIRKQGRTDKWRPKAGSELMHEVLGSQGTVGKARTVFALQPGDPSDNQSDVVVLDAGKCNDGRPNPASAWRRANGEFIPLPDFDLDAWRNPPEDDGRKVLSEEHIRKVLSGVFLTRGEAVEGLMKMGFSQAAAYRALSSDGKFGALIRVVNHGKLTLTEAA